MLSRNVWSVFEWGLYLVFIYLFTVNCGCTELSSTGRTPFPPFFRFFNLPLPERFFQFLFGNTSFLPKKCIIYQGIFQQGLQWIQIYWSVMLTAGHICPIFKKSERSHFFCIMLRLNKRLFCCFNYSNSKLIHKTISLIIASNWVSLAINTNTKHINMYTSSALISGIFGNEALTLVDIVVIVSTVVIPRDTRAAVAS